MGWLKSRRADWRNFRGLSAEEKRLLALSTALLPLLVLAHRFFGLRRVQVVLDQFLPKRGGANEVSPECIRFGLVASRMVQIAAKHGVCRVTCLQKSVLLRWLLARRGIQGDLRIGVRKREGQLEAHAWVELLGQALNDGADVGMRYAPFPASAFSARGVGS